MSLYQKLIICWLQEKGMTFREAKDKTDKLPLGYLSISYLPKELADKIAKGK